MRLALGFPWYNGPSVHAFANYMDLMLYFGALRERSLWQDALEKEEFEKVVAGLPSLDERDANSLGNPTKADWDRLGRLEIILIDFTRSSLVGQARELLVQTAIHHGADYLFSWDSDMLFDHDAFLRLWRHQLPVVGALAFTSREPTYPVITRLFETWDRTNGLKVLGSSPVYDYPKDQLVTREHIKGDVVLGGGVVLYDMKVFSKVPRPWFYSTGVGEDWHFCARAREHNVFCAVDTSVKTKHLAHEVRWIDESYYWKQREQNHSAYVNMAKKFGLEIATVSGDSDNG